MWKIKRNEEGKRETSLLEGEDDFYIKDFLEITILPLTLFWLKKKITV